MESSCRTSCFEVVGNSLYALLLAASYRELERKVVGITATMLTKCLRELEQDRFITRAQYNTIPPTVEYSLAERGKTLIPALESVYKWAEDQMK